MAGHLGEELLLLNAVTNAQRSLLTLHHPGEVTDVLVSVVERLGGRVVPAHLEDADAIPIDLTLGDTDPLVPVAPDGTPARERLERLLPGLVEQARRIVGLLDAAEASRHLDETDLLTGWPKRTILVATAERAVAGEDRFVGFAIEHPERVVETYGRARLDALVRALARLVESLRHPADHGGRLTGPGVGLLLVRSGEDRSGALTGEVLRRWPTARLSDVDLRVADLAVEDPVRLSLTRLESRLGLVQAVDDPGATHAEDEQKAGR